MNHPLENNTPAPSFNVLGLPEQLLETYARLWQLETWLRELVYVQLRAKSGDMWDGEVKRALGPKNYDKRLVHMPTVEESLLSYAQLSELVRIIDDNWTLFESFLPPQNIWKARLDEIEQIRHRVAHFRSTHRDDLRRVEQLLRDLDNGFWRFCTSYNNAQPIFPESDDPVIHAVFNLDLFSRTEIDDGKWIRYGSAIESDRFTVKIEVLRMPWMIKKRPVAGESGFLYDVLIYARGVSHLDQEQLLKSTRALHEHVVHVCLDSAEKAFRITIPACIGEDKVKMLIGQFYEAALYALVRGSSMVTDNNIQQLANNYPEYVLGPHNPMTFLSPDMPCSFFSV